MTAEEAETEAARGAGAKRCPVCNQHDCDGTVCNPRAAVDTLLDALKLRLGVDIEAEADAQMGAHFAEVAERARADVAASAIARWFRAIADGGQLGTRPSCPNCGGWLYVDVDARDGAVELHAAGTREIVCLNCARRWYVWVGSRRG